MAEKKLARLEEWLDEDVADYAIVVIKDFDNFYMHEDGCVSVFLDEEEIGDNLIPQPDARYYSETEHEWNYVWDVGAVELAKAALKAKEVPPNPVLAPVKFLQWCAEHGAI